MNYSSKLIVLIISAVIVMEASASTSIIYTDKLGRTVAIPTPVNRVVFFQTYELIPALGIWDRVVGIGRWAYDNDLMRAAKPDIAKKIPSAGTGTDINIEALLKLKPDLVITWSFKPENIRFMEEKGLKVISIYPESLEELYSVMKLHGKLFKKEREIENAIKEMQKFFSLISARLSNLPANEKKKALWLFSKPTSIACGIGVTNDIFNIIGVINPAASIQKGNADVPMEKIIAWNPDVIFIWGNAKYFPKDIIENPQWRLVKAVKEGQVYKAPEWSTWSPRLAPVALWMAAKTYPSYFADIDLDKYIDDFYQKVLKIPYKKVKKID